MNCSNISYVQNDDSFNETVTQHDKEYIEAIKSWQTQKDRAIEAFSYMIPLGILLNVMFLYVVARIPTMRTVINAYLANLAVADSLYLSCVLFFALQKETSTVGEIVEFVSASNNVASYLTVVSLAYERFVAVCHPLTLRTQSSKFITTKRLAKVWTAAIITGSGGHSVFYWSKSTIALMLLVIIFTAGLVTVIYFYTRIIKKLQEKPKITSTDDHHVRLRRVIVTLILNTAVFFVLNIAKVTVGIYGFVILLLFEVSSGNAFQPPSSLGYFAIFTFVCNVFNGSVNTLVYSGVNKDYGEAFVKAFPCLNPKRCCRCFCRSLDTSQQPAQEIELQDIRHGQDTPQHPAQQTDLQDIRHGQDTPQQPEQQSQLQEICHS